MRRWKVWRSAWRPYWGARTVDHHGPMSLLFPTFKQALEYALSDGTEHVHDGKDLWQVLWGQPESWKGEAE